MIEELRDYDWGTTKQLAIKSKELKELEEKLVQQREEAAKAMLELNGAIKQLQELQKTETK